MTNTTWSSLSSSYFSPSWKSNSPPEQHLGWDGEHLPIASTTDFGGSTVKGDSTKYIFVSGLKNQRVKRFSSKSKNGCETCKRRRIRCDQGRPTCVNCNRSNRTCEGYQTLYVNFSRKFETSKGQKSSSIISLLPEYGDADEKRWLGVFLEKTAILISKFSTPYFWMTLVPQASWNFVGIRHALVAVAMACEEHDNMHVNPTGRGLERVRSMYHYNEAIRVITQEKQPKEIVLLICVLFWTYENLKNRPVMAIAHLKAAIDMLNEDRQMITQREDVISKYVEPCIQETLLYVSTVIPTGGQKQRLSPSMGTFQKALIDLAPEELPRDIHASRSDLDKCQRITVMSKHMAMSRDNPQLVFELVHENLQKWKSVTDKHSQNWPQDDVRLLLAHFEITSISVEVMKAHFTGPKLNFEVLRPKFAHLLSEMHYLASIDLRRHKTIDMSLIKVLSFIGRQHPEDEVAFAAISILEQYEFFEGILNSRVVAEMIRMMRMLDADCAACKYGDLASLFNKSSELMRAGKERLPRRQSFKHAVYDLTHSAPRVALPAC